MKDNLVIVESPEKARTIQKFLGDDFNVKSSKGHIRDLNKSKLSIDIEHGFKPEYEIPDDKKAIVAELKKAAREASVVWLASDEDREGEAISWHLYETLGLKKENTRRIVFHEITNDAIQNAIRNPRDIDMNLVDAQQARRVLDRLVGFELSPILWRKIQPKLSAGRVQSVALRLVVDREKEIIGFRKERYFRTEAVFHPESLPGNVTVRAVLDKRFGTDEQARQFLEGCALSEFSITDIEKKEGTRSPAAPFTTSTLQQEAAKRLHFSVSQTMSIAQTLYESGYITYMRTDSTSLSSLAINKTKEYILGNFGEKYSRPRQYKTRSKGAQEAHEAIRPTFISNTSIPGTPQEKRLYDLIWKRTVASQMSDAGILKTDITVSGSRVSEKFSAQSTEILFDGFLKLYNNMDSDEGADREDVILPELNTGERMEAREISAVCKFTAPPARYSQGTLVKKMEELGIGRPSTYGPTISTLTKGRGYLVEGNKEGEKTMVTDYVLKGGTIVPVERVETTGAEKGRLFPQEIGMIVTDFLVDKFRTILDYDFTANVEKEFDQVAAGDMKWESLISSFYSPFHEKVEETLNNREYGHVSKELGVDPSDGQPVVAKYGQYGPYIQKGEGENRQFASLAPGQLIESITLEEALKLFSLPRVVGQYEGVDVIATKGRFGPYLKYGDRNISLPKGTDPVRVDLARCIEIICQAGNKPEKQVISDFKDSGIQVIAGNYGPYIKFSGNNYRIPKGTDAAAMTEDDCRKIIEEGAPTSRSRRKRK